MKNSNDTIRIRNRDLPVCSAVHQPTAPPSVHHLWCNVEKYSRVGQAANDNILWRMLLAWWILEDTNTYSEYVILIAFPLKNGWTTAPQCYVIRTLPVLFASLCVVVSHMWFFTWIIILKCSNTTNDIKIYHWDTCRYFVL